MHEQMYSSELAINQLTLVAHSLLEQLKIHCTDDTANNELLLNFILDAFYEVGCIAIALDAPSKKTLDDAMMQRRGNCSVCGRAYHLHINGLFCRGSTWTEP